MGRSFYWIVKGTKFGLETASGKIHGLPKLEWKEGEQTRAAVRWASVLLVPMGEGDHTGDAPWLPVAGSLPYPLGPRTPQALPASPCICIVTTAPLARHEPRSAVWVLLAPSAWPVMAASSLLLASSSVGYLHLPCLQPVPLASSSSS